MKIVLTLAEIVALSDWATDQFTSLKSEKGVDYYGSMGEVDVIIGDNVTMDDPEFGTISTRPRDYFTYPEKYIK